MKYSELKEMIRRAVSEKKLTAAEKKKKEDIVKGMKKSFKGDKAAMYAIATAKAKKLAEADELNDNYTHFAIDKSTGKIVDGWEYTDLDNESIKQYATMDLKDNFPERKPSDFKLVTRKFLERNGINPDDTHNWFKITKPLSEVKGEELTSKIFDIGSTLKKVEAAMDYGIDQDPQVIQGLDQAYAELLNILPIIEKDREERSSVYENTVKEGGDHEVSMALSSLEAIAKAIIELKQKLGNQERNIPGWIQDHIAKAENYIEQAAQGFHELKMEEKDPLNVVVSEETPGKQDILAGKLYGLKNKLPEEVFYAIRKLINSGNLEKAEELLNRLIAPKQPTSVKADPSTFSVNEKKGKDLDGDGDVDSDDYLKARDIAIQKAKAKKAK